MKKALAEIFLLVFVLVACVLIFGRNKTAIPTPVTTVATGLHYASDGAKEFFEDAYAHVSLVKPTDPIAGITVNHHLLAPNLIAQEFSLVATDKPITVILISPNHFYRGNGGVISSRFDWQTPYGVLQINQSSVDTLTKTGLVNVDETPFTDEHGINNEVGFIKRSLPNATFVPLIVKDNATDDQIDKLAAELAKTLPSDALVIESIDFSHYLPSNGADFHDIETLAAIHNFDYDRIKHLDINSHQGLRLGLKYFDLKGDKKFVLTNDSNSSKVTGDYQFVETTSYIDGYFTAGANAHDDHKVVLYANNLPNELQEARLWNPLDPKYAFANTERLFQYNDQAFTNFQPLNSDTKNFMNKLGLVTASIDLPSAYQYLLNSNSPVALGLVYNPGLTAIYEFPLSFDGSQIGLPVESKPDKLLIQIK